jgi:hypothetical protein
MISLAVAAAAPSRLCPEGQQTPCHRFVDGDLVHVAALTTFQGTIGPAFWVAPAPAVGPEPWPPCDAKTYTVTHRGTVYENAILRDASRVHRRSGGCPKTVPEPMAQGDRLSRPMPVQTVLRPPEPQVRPPWSLRNAP